jgi:2-polyprenyl-6-methoxyphenol hydroxylase-like FAD-dependent oxidoreductase
MLPVDFRWTHRAGVTLLGDAAALMTPFAGECVNLAFKDSMKLANAIIEAAKTGGKGVLQTSIAVYEDLFRQINKAQKMTNNMMLHRFFTEGAPRSTIEAWMLERMYYNFEP